MAVTISWNEIRARAVQFARDWSEEESERAEAQTFWNEFFSVFGMQRRRVAIFERKVEKLDRSSGRIDLFWPGQLLAEHKSRGQNLDAAFEQATDYFAGLEEKDVPRYVVVSDFQQVRIVDLEAGTDSIFSLKDFPKHIKLFGFIAGYKQKEVRDEDPVNLKAANKMAVLHETIEGIGYSGHQLEVFMVRILFCLFAEDSGIFDPGIFREYIEDRTHSDGSDLGQHLQLIFQTLDTPNDKRLATLDEALHAFPYVNGNLFSETLPIVSFNSSMRRALLEACAFDWSVISPAVFGSMFQSIMDKDERRNLGAHYTSEKNILKVIQTLFMDDLWREFERAGKQKDKLNALLQKIAKMRLLDPACGCGNFLVIAYRELRRLELAILKSIYSADSHSLFGGDILTLLNVDQLYGIEYEEFPARVAEVAMWLTDHQMNLELGEAFGKVPERLPLTKSARIVIGNALQTDWSEVMAGERPTYILGNPPFVGSKLMSKVQREDILALFPKVTGNGTLDYVSGWYAKAAAYIQGTNIEVAFVSTNSITQGEQVGILWKYLIDHFGIVINFAHKTFKWRNDAKGVAGVYCVIIGFGLHDREKKYLYEYESVSGEPLEVEVDRINPYLVDAPDVFIMSRSKPICDVPTIHFGNQPNDGGHLLLSELEKNDIVTAYPEAAKYIRPFVGAREFINGGSRFCLWLVGADPSEIRNISAIVERIEKVREYRLSSSREATRDLAKKPSIFGFMSHEEKDYILIPSVSSERRDYIPIGFMPPSVIPSNLVLTIYDANLYHFGVLTSLMHMTWVRSVGGRLESRYRYSNKIVYNNFLWPTEVREGREEQVKRAAQYVLDVRNTYPSATLADLYDPNTMPADLLKAHQALDKAVDACYRSKPFKGEGERMSFLLGVYEKLNCA